MRIYDYPLKTNLSGTEKLLGSSNKETKNFTIDSISDYAISKFNLTPQANITSADKISIFQFINSPRSLDLILSATSTIVQNIGDIKTFGMDVNYVYLYCDSPDTGSYTATINFYTTDDGINLKLLASDELSKDKTFSSLQIFLKNKSYCATVNVNGIVPQSGINVKVMV